MYINTIQKNSIAQILFLWLLGFLLPFASKAQELTPFDCVPNFYQSVSSEGILVRYNVIDFSEGFDTISTLGININALAYHPETDFMYAIQSTNRHLIKIGAGGAYEDLGDIGLPTSVHVGEIDPNGDYFIKSNTNAIYKIDIDNLTFTTLTPANQFSAADWAYNHTDNKIYGVRQGNLHVFDSGTNTVDIRPLIGFEPNETNGFGAAFYTVDGSIYIHSNGTGNIYKVDVVNNTVQFVIKGPDQLSINDGASCPFALPPFPVIYAENDVAETPMNTAVNIDIKDNDDVHFAIIDNQSFEEVESPLHGSATFNPNNGILSYTPEPDFYGIDSLQYQFCDQSYPDFCDVAWVYIYVTTSAELDVAICENEVYNFDNQFLSQAGVYEATFVSSQAVDSIVTLTLAVLPHVETNLVETICEGEVYQVGDSFYHQSGNYSDVLSNYTDCDSTVYLDLTVLADIETPLSITICEGESYQVGTSTYSQSGNYTDVLSNYADCDSTVYLDLTVLSDISTNLEATICNGEVYQVGDFFYHESGNYTNVLSNYANCDSTVYLNLTVLSEIETNLVETICEGEVYQVGDSFYHQSGNYTNVFNNYADCDSTVYLDLTVLSDISTDLEVTICEGEVYQVGDSFYHESGNYTNVLNNYADCDSTIYLDLTVLADINTHLEVVICDGETYQVGNSTYTQSGNYSDVLSNYADCDSTVYLDLTVLPEIETALVASICEGEVYQVDDFFYHESGHYTNVLSNYADCDSTIYLDLTVFPNVSSTLDTLICQGEIFEYQGVEYVESTSFVVTLSTEEGCDSTVQVALSVHPFMIHDVDAEICNGDTYTFNGNVYNTTGNYSVNLIDQYGCDSVVVLDLEVREAIMTDLNETICEGETYQVGNSIYTQNGNYTDVLTSYQGCDSTVNLSLMVVPFIKVELEEAICEGETYQVGNSIYTQSGDYTDILTSYQDCDSTVNLSLTVFPNPITDLTQSICEGEVYQVGTSFYHQNGNYTNVLINENGCDSTVNLNLTVLPNLSSTLDTLICEGETFEYLDEAYFESTSFIANLTTIDGCDSTVTVHLTVHPYLIRDVQAGICEGETYEFNNQFYTQTGTYSANFIDQYGCDSLVILNLQVTENIEIHLVEGICEGESYQVGDNVYISTGNYSNSFTAAGGCDSLVHLDLTVFPNPITNLAQSICEGEVYQVGTSFYHENGNYTDVLINENGCDSTVNLNLTVFPNLSSTLDTLICEGEVFEYQDIEYFVNTSFVADLSTVDGCDSTVTVNLTVHPYLIRDIEIDICAGESYEFDETTYTETGIYTATFTDQYDCDSMVVLVLNVHNSIENTVEESICEGETFVFGEDTYTDAGEYTHTFTATGGCDSTVQLTLAVLSHVEQHISTTICEGETYDLGTSTYTQSGNYTEVLSAENTCDSTVHLTLTVLPSIENQLDINVCAGETYEVGTSVYTESGNYTDILTSINGCDSIVNLNLTILNNIENSIEINICEGETYEVGNSIYTESGNYTDVLTSVHGCDSSVSLTLLVLPNMETQLAANICDGDIYVVGNSVYTESGNYTDILTSVNGCDSIIFTNLAVHGSQITAVEAGICLGESYEFDGIIYDTSGEYTASFTDEFGCDSTVVLNLQVVESIELSIVESICEGESFTLGDESYTSSGIYNETFIAMGGCDSLVTLDLTVLPVANSSLTASICEGESYEIGNSIYTESGDYTEILTNINGCDSTVNLSLTVLSTSETQLIEQICTGESILFNQNTYTETGIYTSSLIAANGCDSVVILDLTVHDLPQPEMIGAASFCAGTITTLTLTNDYTTYQWSTGANSPSIEIDSAATYQVTVTNANNCSGVATLLVEETTIPVPEISSASNPSDCGLSDGQITVQTSGTAAYLYSINGGISWSESGVFENLESGMYEIIASNLDTTCQSMLSESITLDMPEAPMFTSVVAENPTDCEGQNGMITIQTSSTNPLLYSIDNGLTWQESPVFENVASGTYQAMISNPDGTCLNTYNENVTIETITPLSVQLVEVYPPLCHDEANGGAIIEASGGYQAYTYTWSNGQTTAELTEVEAGNYTVTIQDANNCETTLAIDISNPPIFDIQLTERLDTTLCLGQTATFHAGSAEHDYEWQNQQGMISTANEITVTESGLYTVKAINENNCIATDSVTVHFTEEFFQADFLLPAEGLIDEPIVAIEVSFPIPDSIRWEYNQDSIFQKQNIQNQEIVTIPHPGVYEITMYAYRGDCEMKVTKTIQIFETVEELLNPDNVEPGFTEILEFTLFPVPNDGQFDIRVALSDKTPIQLYIFREDGLLIDERSLSGQYLYLEQYNLTNLQTGVYAAILQTGSEWRYFTFVVY